MYFENINELQIYLPQLHDIMFSLKVNLKYGITCKGK